MRYGMSRLQSFATFYLDRMYLGIEVMRVQEILPYQRLTRMPLAPREVAGLINLRGQIVPAVDLRRRLGLPAASEPDLPMNIVVRSEDGPISLLVDEVGDVIEAPEEAFEPAVQAASRTAGRLVQGVYKLPHRLLLVLDADQAISLDSSPGAAPCYARGSEVAEEAGDRE